MTGSWDPSSIQINRGKGEKESPLDPETRGRKRLTSEQILCSRCDATARVTNVICASDIQVSKRPNQFVSAWHLIRYSTRLCISCESENLDSNMAQTMSEALTKFIGVLAFLHMIVVLLLASQGVGAASMDALSPPATSSKCEKMLQRLLANAPVNLNNKNEIKIFTLNDKLF